MTPESRRAIESILMVADQPVEPTVLAQLLEVPKADVEAACRELAAEYDANGRGFVLVRVAGGYRFQSHPDLAPYVERFVLEGQSSRLSSAALETLAIVAYKQPISRMQVAAIRGVNVDGVLRTLQQRGYVDEVDRDPGPGNAVLFGTTPLFLERVGLDSLDDLPPLADFVPGADVVEALEDGLRPEPVGEVAADAAAMAEAEAGLAADGADAGSGVEDDPGAGPGSDGDAVSSEDEAAPEVDVGLVEVEVEDDDDDDVGLVEDEVAPEVDVGLVDVEDDAALVEVVDEVDVDLTGDHTLDNEASGQRAHDLSPPSTSTIRHEIPDHVDDGASFRSAPGAGTGGEGLAVAAGLEMGEDQARSTEAEGLSPIEDGGERPVHRTEARPPR